MPVRRLALLLGLYGLCLAIVGAAWASGSELYIAFAKRLFGAPPSHPVLILSILLFGLPLTIWMRQGGVLYFVLMTVCIALGGPWGYFRYGWTPDWAQYVLTAGMIATSIYAWQQKTYFEE